MPGSRGGTPGLPSFDISDDPGHELLRHKRHGVWRSWSRAAVARGTARLAGALGIGPGALVAVSGDYTPTLVLFALAAARSGAGIVAAPSDPARWLDDHQPDLVFLGARDALGPWRAALAARGQTARIIAGFDLPWARPGATEIPSARDLLAEPGTESAPAAADVLWIEEGTDWPEGLAVILQALGQGRTVAFPESRIAAHRDRRQVQPTAFALSPAHHAALVADLSARLPIGTSLTARLITAALAAGRGGRPGWHHRLLLARVRRSFGLARPRQLTVVAADLDAVGDTAAADPLAGLGIRAGHTAASAAAEPAPALAEQGAFA